MVFVSPVNDNSLHQHLFIQLTIGLSSEINISFDGISKTAQSVLINSNHAHQLNSCDKFSAVILIDTELEVANLLRHTIFNKRDVYFPDFNLFKKHENELNRLSSGNVDMNSIENLVKSLIASFGVNAPGSSSLKSRKIKNILKILQDLPDEAFGVKRLAKEVDLSEGRLTHLFKQEVGMPVRRYILWLRLQKAVIHIINGSIFTDAAYFAGFADSAHLSRTFRKMFGQKMLVIFSSNSTSSPIMIKTSLIK